MTEDKMVGITNISNTPVEYSLPEIRVLRKFRPGETKKVSTKEIQMLSYDIGGLRLLQEYLTVQDDSLIAELQLVVEPEAKWTASDVEEMLLHGSIERLQDCLDFAPSGIIDLVKDKAVDLLLNDMNKRQAILDSTGFNVTNAIRIKQQTEDAPEVVEKKRRVPVDTPAEVSDVPKVTTHYKTTS